MNDSPENKDQAQGRDESSGGWRAVTRVAVAAIIGFVAVATVHQMLYEPTSSDGVYEWTLRWPGTQPGAKFKTEQGDDIRRLLEALVADAGADWQGPLTESGTIEVQLSHPASPSLWTILKWRFGLLKGPQDLASQRVLLTVRLSEVAKQPLQYEVVRIGAEGNEVISGTCDNYRDAQGIVLDELARVMDDYQS